MLSSEASAEPGRWSTDRAPYQRGIMDALNDPSVDEVVFMASAQVGKTEVLLNAIGYFSEQDPSPIMLLQPTLELAQAFSKDRVAPMIRDTPRLTKTFPDPKSRDGDNGLLYKKFAGGHLTMSGANSPASLASRPIRVVLADEIDQYPTTVGKRGDPLALAYKRANNFHNAVRMCISTPTESGNSRIEMKFLEGDQRYFLVPCPHCDHAHRLIWDNVHWDTDEETGEVSEDVWMVCPECGGVIEEGDKARMIARADQEPGLGWTASKRFRGIASFHISELYSTWRTWRETRDDFLTAKVRPDLLKTWVNEALGEVWQEAEETTDPDAIANRREPFDWREELPRQALLLTAGVDVQDDRLEYEIVAWSEGWESWGIETRVLTGDPGKAELWKRLEDELLNSSWTRDDGTTMNIPGIAVDSGGHYTTEVYTFAKKHPGRVFAIKGAAGSREVVSRPTRNNKLKVPLFTLGVDAIKELLFFSYLKTVVPGPGYCHFPAHYDDTYFDQLTNEVPVKRYKNGVPVRMWKAVGRNEALDNRVYAYAAARILNPNFRAIAKRLAPDDGGEEQETEKQVSINKQRKKAKQRRRRRGGFVTNY
ncbi:phage terminase large subunit family protein [Marinihelvus fidelis]|nr:phage terminase large subunit family protein [Marinihelvus fidelis]